MILPLAGQSQWLSHVCTWEISGVCNGIRIHDLCDASLILLPTVLYKATQMRAGQFVGLMCSPERNNASEHVHLKFLRCTHETIAENVQQVWESFLQVIFQPHFTNISFTHKQLYWKDGMALSVLMMWVMVAWQQVKELLKRFSDFQIGIEPRTSVTPIGHSNQWATRTSAELSRLTWFFTQSVTLTMQFSFNILYERKVVGSILT